MSLLKKIKDIQGTPSSKESIKKFGGVKYPEGSPGAQHALSKKMEDDKRDRNSAEVQRRMSKKTSPRLSGNTPPMKAVRTESRLSDGFKNYK